MSTLQVEELKRSARVMGRASTDDGDTYYQAYLRTLECVDRKNCGMRLRVARVLYGPSPVGALKFCALCGGPATAVNDEKATYVESIAQSYGLPPEVMKLLLDEWDSHEFAKFSDFVKEMLSGVDDSE